MLIRVLLMVILLGQLLVAEGKNYATAHEEFSDPDLTVMHGPSLVEPPPEFEIWVMDLRHRISAVQKKEPALAKGIKIPVICTFDVASDGALSRLTFKQTSGDQDNDTCALETIRKAAPFDHLPIGARESRKFAVEVGATTLKIWQIVW